MMRDSIVVVIPTHRRNELLQRTLHSLGQCELPSTFSETIVVENGGRFGAEEVCTAAPAWLNIRYVYHENGNKSEALNQVLDRVDDSWLLFFDDDVRFEVGTIAGYARAVQGQGVGHYFGGPVGIDYERQPPDWVKLPASARGWSLPVSAEQSLQTLFLGFNWAAHSQDLRRVGGFDPNFGPGSPTGARGQESNMQLRLQASNVRPQYVADAMVWHFVPESRCSVEWSLDRVYQHAVESGLRSGEGTRTGVPMLFGIPRWRVRELAGLYWSLALAVICGSRKARYRARLGINRHLGFLKGLRIRTASDSDG